MFVFPAIQCIFFCCLCACFGGSSHINIVASLICDIIIFLNIRYSIEKAFWAGKIFQKSNEYVTWESYFDTNANFATPWLSKITSDHSSILEIKWLKVFFKLSLSVQCLPPTSVEQQSPHEQRGRRLHRSSAPFLDPNCGWRPEAGPSSPAQPSRETLGSLGVKSLETYSLRGLNLSDSHHHYRPPSSSISEHLEELFPTKTPAGEISSCSRRGRSPRVLAMRANRNSGRNNSKYICEIM